MLFAAKLTPAAILAILVTIALAATKLVTAARFYATGQDLLWQGPLNLGITWSLALATCLSARGQPRGSFRRVWKKAVARTALVLLAAAVLIAVLFQLRDLISPRVISDVSTAILLLLLLYSLWRSHTLPRTPPLPNPWAA